MTDLPSSKTVVYPTPWRLESRNDPIADTGDYDGVIAIKSADGKTITEAWNPSDDDVVAFQRIIDVMNAHDSQGVHCVHCNGKGVETQHYDEQAGWSDPDVPCATCGGSGRIRTVGQYLKTVPANWHEDSSVRTWFPLLDEEVARLRRAEASCNEHHAEIRPVETTAPSNRKAVTGIESFEERRKTLAALDALEAMSEEWAESISLDSIAANLARRPDFNDRCAAIRALIVQAHMEGLYTGRTSHSSAEETSAPIDAVTKAALYQDRESQYLPGSPEKAWEPTTVEILEYARRYSLSTEEARKLLKAERASMIGAVKTKVIPCVWQSGCKNHRICDEMGCCQQLGAENGTAPISKENDR